MRVDSGITGLTSPNATEPVQTTAGGGPTAPERSALAIVTVNDDGKTYVDTPSRIVGTSAVSGALWGALLGLLFFVPGMALLAA
jgi:hypothetical protein